MPEASREELLKALEESEEKYRGLYDSIRDGIVRTDMQGRIQECNQAYLDMLGYTLDELRQLTYHRFTPEKWHAWEAELIKEQVIGRGYTDLYEKEYIRKDGTVFPVSVRAWLIRGEGGEPEGMWGFFRDITHRKRVEESLRASEERFRGLVEQSPDGIALLKRNGRILEWNRAMQEMTGMHRGEALGRYLWDIQSALSAEDKRDPMARRRLREAIEDGLGSGEAYWLNRQQELEIHRSDGNIVFLQTLTFPIQTSSDTVYACIVTDVTSHRRADEFSSAVIQSSPAFFVAIDAADRVVRMNQAMLDALGYEADEVIGQDYVNRFIPERERARVAEVFRELITSDRAGPNRNPVLARDGRELLVEWQNQQVFKPNGDFDYFFGIGIDITERRKADEQLRQERDFSSTVIQSSPAFFVAIDAENRVIMMNRAMLDALGYGAEEVVGLDYLESFVPEREHAALTLVFQELTGTDRPTFNQNLVLTRDGRELLVEWHGRQVFKPGGDFDYFFGMGIDITERKAAEEEIRRKVLELDALHQASLTFLDQADLETLLGDICRFTVDHFGLRMAWIGTVREGDFEVRPTAVHGDEGDYIKEIRVTWDDTPTGRGPTGMAIRSGLPQVADHIERDPAYDAWKVQAEKHGYRSSAALPLRYEQRVIGALNVYSDQSDYFSGERLQVLKAFANSAAVALNRAELFGEVKRHAAELERKVAERTASLEAANRELEAFSYSVSHDLRAPLRAMDGFSRALMEDYAQVLDGEALDYLMRVRAASQHMAQLIEDMLTLSRLSRAEMSFEAVDLSAIAGTVAKGLAEELPEREAEFVIAPHVTAWGDARILRQVLENLLGNAWKFTGKHQRARIEFGVTETDGRATYFVRDDGAGFDMSYADKLFGIFQRIHSSKEFPGTGVGLAIVQRMIQRHGGEVWARGEVEKGATFYFTLPAEDP